MRSGTGYTFDTGQEITITVCCPICCQQKPYRVPAWYRGHVPAEELCCSEKHTALYRQRIKNAIKACHAEQRAKRDTMRFVREGHLDEVTALRIANAY